MSDTSPFDIRLASMEDVQWPMMTKEDVQNVLSNLSEDHLTQALIGSMVRKTLQDLQKEEKNMVKYFGIWDNFESMKESFERRSWFDDSDETPPHPPVDIKDNNVLWATYTYENYSGSAHVIFEKDDGKLFEVYGSHCSCNGLEGQWEPGFVTWGALALRLKGLNVEDENAEDDYVSPFRYQPLEARKAFYELVSSKVGAKHG